MPAGLTHPRWGVSQLSTKLKARQYHDLLPVTRKLIRRIKKEYQNYLLEDKDIDVEKAMMANPLTCVSAPSLFQMIGIYDESDVARVKTQFIKDILGNFCDNTPNRIANDLIQQGATVVNSSGTRNGNTGDTASGATSSAPVYDVFAEMQKRQEAVERAFAFSGTASRQKLKQFDTISSRKNAKRKFATSKNGAQ